MVVSNYEMKKDEDGTIYFVGMDDADCEVRATPNVLLLRKKDVVAFEYFSGLIKSPSLKPEFGITKPMVKVFMSNGSIFILKKQKVIHSIQMRWKILIK